MNLKNKFLVYKKEKLNSGRRNVEFSEIFRVSSTFNSISRKRKKRIRILKVLPIDYVK